LVLVALNTGSLFSASPSSADAVADKRAEAERITRQLEEQGRRVSILAEDYDEARVRIEALEGELTSARQKVAMTDTRASAIRLRLKDQAVAAYMRGGSTQALSLLVGIDKTDDIAVRSHYIRSLSSGASDVLDELRAVKTQLDEQRERLGDAQSEAKVAATLAESKRKEAATAEAAQRKTLGQVQGELATLVEAETQRRAEEEAKRAQAELAARKARADAAAREAELKAAVAREAAAKESEDKEAAARDAAKRTTTTTAKAPSGASVPGPVVTVRPTTTTAPATTTTRPTTTTTSPSIAPSGGSTTPPSAGAAAAIAEARRQIGKPYEWGGSGPDTFDCSGLTSWAWRAGGKSLPHSSRAQWTATSRVNIDAIQPGDLLFYGEPIHHVGLYIGDGQMIEAPETGKNVRYGSIFRRDLVGAGRVN